MSEESKQEYGVVIAKKSERLVTALYLVTDLVDGSEPIKNRLRSNAVVLLSSMNSLTQHGVKDKMSLFAASLTAVTEIISLLHVAATTGMISDMNGTLLINGFRVLQSILEKKQPTVTEAMLHVDREEQVYAKTEHHPGIVSTSYDALTPRVLAQESLHEKRVEHVTDMVEHKGQENVLYKKSSEQSVNPPLHTVLMQHVSKRASGLSSSFQTRKQSRRDQILALFVKGVDVSIKDIAARIKGCSEKTIQRELNALLYDNIIERIGEKRWSRYVLR